MANITIERLTLNLTGLSPEEGRRLAHSIAAALAAAPASIQAGGNRDRVAVAVNATPDASVDHLAEQIVAELLQQMKRGD